MHSTYKLVEHILLARMSFHTSNAVLLKAISESLYRLRLDSATVPKITVPDYVCEAVIASDAELVEALHRYVYNAPKKNILTLIKRHAKQIGIKVHFPPIGHPAYLNAIGLWGVYPVTTMIRDDVSVPTAQQEHFIRSKLI